MPNNPFEDSRNSEGTRELGASNPKVAPDRESVAISRDDVRDGFAEGTGSADNGENPRKLSVDRRRRRVLAASTITGDRVRNTDGEDLGKIESIMLDLQSGKVAYAVLSFGGFLGIGNKLFAVPWSALKVDEGEHEFILNVSREKLDKAPGFDKDNWPDMAAPDFGDSIHQHYGSTPYWQHDTTDTGDYVGDNNQPNRSIEFEQTTSYRAGGN